MLILGLDASGKTTILKRMKYNTFCKTAPTEGFNVKSITLNDIKVNVWDLGG